MRCSSVSTHCVPDVSWRGCSIHILPLAHVKARNAEAKQLPRLFSSTLKSSFISFFFFFFSLSVEHMNGGLAEHGQLKNVTFQTLKEQCVDMMQGFPTSEWPGAVCLKANMPCSNAANRPCNTPVLDCMHPPCCIVEAPLYFTVSACSVLYHTMLALLSHLTIKPLSIEDCITLPHPQGWGQE